MEKNIIHLTKQERNLLIMTMLHPNGEFLSNSEIAQRLGVPVNTIKRLIHQILVKLKVQNRNEAILTALKLGEIKLSDYYSLDELSEILGSIGPDNLRIIAKIAQQSTENTRTASRVKHIVLARRRSDGKLTNRERDVVILIGYGLTNKEIANKLFMSIGSVRVFLNRACSKLGARKRADVFIMALKQGEITIGEFCPFKETIPYLVPLGSDTLEKLAQMLEQKHCQNPVPAVY